MRWMSWKYFTLTGDVDAYMLYKDIHRAYDEEIVDEDWAEDEEEYGPDSI
jgi:hypothetical protein